MSLRSNSSSRERPLFVRMKSVNDSESFKTKEILTKGEGSSRGSPMSYKTGDSLSPEGLGLKRTVTTIGRALMGSKPKKKQSNTSSYLEGSKKMKQAIMEGELKDVENTFTIAAHIPIVDGFGCSLKQPLIHNSGHFITKTAHGYFK